MDGLIYEPRSFWSVATGALTSKAQLVQVDRNHFMNGERWPVTIDRIALGGVNYLLRESAAGGNAPSAATIINRIGIRFSVPQRYHVNVGRPIMIGSIPMKSTGQHATPIDTLYGAPFTPSSQYGQCHLTFKKPLLIPKNAQIEWDLSAHTPAAIGTGPGANERVPSYCEMAYVELGGLTGSSMRARTVQLAAYLGDLTPTIEGWPYPPDVVAAGGGAIAPALTSKNWWPPTSRFPAGGGSPDWLNQRNTTFSAQEATRSGSTELVGLRTTIPQVELDINFNTDVGIVEPCSPLSMRTGCRMRTVNGGSSGHWWWRPGAPLALVFDTITPANVIPLQEPITLGPGEQLNVELEVPGIDTETFTSNYSIGVAFNGYATIES